MGVGPIPYFHIIDYAKRAELDRDLEDPFIQIIEEMDKAYLNWTNEQSEKQTNMQNVGNKTKEK